MKYRFVPIGLKEIRGFISKHHSHHPKPPIRDKFRVGLVHGNKLIGVIMMGRPVNRHLDNGQNLEVNRCCVLSGYKNASSMLYGAATRAAKEMGMSKVYTYTLDFEQAVSLRASNWKIDGKTKGSEWNSKSRPRKSQSEYQKFDKVRWVKILREEFDLSQLAGQCIPPEENNQLQLFNQTTKP